jgi:hypothetical protein
MKSRLSNKPLALLSEAIVFGTQGVMPASKHLRISGSLK